MTCPTSGEIERCELRPDATECNHRAERGLKLLVENPGSRAVRIGSKPNPMYVTIEDGAFVFWTFNYTWRCQEQVPIEESHSCFETVVDELHSYANRDYPIETVSKERIDSERKPRATGLEDFA